MSAHVIHGIDTSDLPDGFYPYSNYLTDMIAWRNRICDQLFDLLEIALKFDFEDRDACLRLLFTRQTALDDEEDDEVHEGEPISIRFFEYIFESDRLNKNGLAKLWKKFVKDKYPEIDVSLEGPELLVAMKNFDIEELKAFMKSHPKYTK